MAKEFVCLAEAPLRAEPVLFHAEWRIIFRRSMRDLTSASWPWTMDSSSEWNDALRMREIEDAGIAFSFDKGRKVASIAENPAISKWRIPRATQGA